MTDTPWLNQKESAEYANQSVPTIRAAVRSGDLVAVAVGKSGKGYRIHKEALDKWMWSRTWEPVA